jgi:hypothetical protein
VKTVAIVGLVVLWIGNSLIWFRIADEVDEGRSYEDQLREAAKRRTTFRAHKERYPNSKLRLIFYSELMILALWFIGVVWFFGAEAVPYLP